MKGSTVEMEKEIRLSFFKRLKMSILDFDKYHILASEGVGRAMLYLVKLVLLFSLILAGTYMFKISGIVNNAVGYVKNNTPNFYFQDGSFHVDSENDVIMENHDYINIKVVLSNAENFNEEEINNFDGYFLAALKDKILVKQQNGTSIINISYSQLAKTYSYDINSINKEFLLNSFAGEGFYMVMANVFAITFIATFISYFMTGILYTISISLLGYIVTKFVGMPLKYSAIYNMSISALTLPTMLNLIYAVINTFTGFIIPYFQVMYTLIAYVALIAAILIMKSEITKKKIKVQIQIMNENKQKEMEKQKEEKENEDKKEEENKEKEKKKKEDTPEPQANIKERRT